MANTMQRDAIMKRVLHFLNIISIVGAIAPASPTWGQDAERGKAAFAKCAACHSLDGKNSLGPDLHGVVGRKAGSVEGFRYSRAMKNATIVWDEKTLDTFLDDPQKVAPGTTMPFSGIANARERADLVAYLETLK
jgi:cytochrome c